MFKYLLVVLSLLFSSLSWAKDIPNPPSNYVLDEPHLLSTTAIQNLSQKLQDLDHKDGRQVVVAIMNSLDGENLEDYTNRLARQWHVGQKEKNNGVVLALYLKERKIRIEVGYGLEPYLTDARTRDISMAMGPLLRQNRADDAFSQAVDSIIRDSATPPAEQQPQPKPVVKTEADHHADQMLILGLLFVILVTAGGVIAYTSYNRKKNEKIREMKDEERRQRLLAQAEAEKARLKALYPNLSYQQALAVEAQRMDDLRRQRAEEERKAELARQREVEQRERERIEQKYRVGVAGMTYAAALALEEAERAKRAAEEAKRRKREQEEEEESRRRRSRSSSDSSSGGGSSFGGGGFGDSGGGGFSGGGGDFGGGGSSSGF